MYYRGLPTILVKLQKDKGNTSSKDNRAWGLGPWGDKKDLNIDTTFFLLIIPLFLYVPNGLTCLSMPSYIHHFQLCKNSPDQITSISIPSLNPLNKLHQHINTLKTNGLDRSLDNISSSCSN